MFCNKCGKEVPDSAAFCSSCGEKIQSYSKSSSIGYAPSFSKSSFNLSSPFTYVSSAVTFILTVMLILGKWIKIPVLEYFTDSSTSSFSIISLFLKSFNLLTSRYIEGSTKFGLIVYIIAILIPFIISIFCSIKFIYTGLIEHDIKPKLLKNSLNSVIALFIISLIGIIVINMIAGDATYDLFSNAAKFNSMAYVVIVIAISSRIFLTVKVQEESKNTIPNKNSEFKPMYPNAVRHCPKCGNTIKVDATTCPICNHVL